MKVCIAGVQGLAVGDAVFGVAPGCLGRSVIAAQQRLGPKPPNLSFAEAATTPTGYVTVFQAFGDLSTFSSSSKVGVGPLLCLPHTAYLVPKASATPALALHESNAPLPDIPEKDLLSCTSGVGACWHWWDGPGSYKHCCGIEVLHPCHRWHSPEAVASEGPGRSRGRILPRHQLPGCHGPQGRCGKPPFAHAYACPAHSLKEYCCH